MVQGRLTHALQASSQRSVAATNLRQMSLRDAPRAPRTEAFRPCARSPHHHSHAGAALSQSRKASPGPAVASAQRDGGNCRCTRWCTAAGERTSPENDSKIFSGLTSRCTTGGVCECRNSSPAAAPSASCSLHKETRAHGRFSARFRHVPDLNEGGK
jgi:hypothetical protein